LSDVYYFLQYVEFPPEIPPYDTMKWKYIKETNSKMTVVVSDVTAVVEKYGELWG
jgi:hypothetical protein